MTTITSVEAHDVRFPTSRWLIGSDAMHSDPDYSAAYAIVRTDDRREGHGLTFTIGRGTEVCVAAIDALAPLVIGRRLADITADMAGFWRDLTSDSQMRWLGPEKGVMHLGTAALVNAVWDLYAKSEGKPLWKLLSDMSPAELVKCVDFRYLSDAISLEEAVDLLERAMGGREERETELQRVGIPAYITSAGWLGYPDEKVRALARDASDAGWTKLKMKVGGDLQDDIRRAALLREVIGAEGTLMLDANQRWEVSEAIAWTQELSRFNPLWIEEPTSPDDILGHAAIAKAVAPVAVATGEHVHNRVMFKQLFESEAIGYCQLDTCRLGGVNETVAVVLLAAKYGVPVCPHSGGVGLCEYHQHVAAFDYVCLGGRLESRMVEYADHLHEHFVDPVVVADGRYRLPTRPGTSAEMRTESVDRYRYPYADPEATVLEETSAS